MKNLAQFKKRLQTTLDTNGKIDFSYERKTQYLNHPFAAKFPNGLQQEGGGEQGNTIGRVQTNAFTRVRNSDHKEVWMSFDKAANWSFPDENTAVFTENQDYLPQYTCTLILTYKFI